MNIDNIQEKKEEAFRLLRKEKLGDNSSFYSSFRLETEIKFYNLILCLNESLTENKMFVLKIVSVLTGICLLLVTFNTNKDSINVFFLFIKSLFEEDSLTILQWLEKPVLIFPVFVTYGIKLAVFFFIPCILIFIVGYLRIPYGPSHGEGGGTSISRGIWGWKRVTEDEFSYRVWKCTLETFYAFAFTLAITTLMLNTFTFNVKLMMLFYFFPVINQFFVILFLVGYNLQDIELKKAEKIERDKKKEEKKEREKNKRSSKRNKSSKKNKKY